MVPKALALQRADTHGAVRLARHRARSSAPSLPLVVALNAIGNATAAAGRRHAGRRSSAERYHTPEELQFIVQESQEGGLLRGESGQILRELFEFGDLTAGEVMVPRVLLVGIPVGAEPDELRAIVRTQPHTRYPVYSGDLDNIVGSLHIKEVLRHLISNRPVTARDARPLPYVPGPTPLDEVLAAMRRYRAQMAVVMDQHGGTAGLVTMEDLFEEVVGEIEEGRGRAADRSRGERRGARARHGAARGSRRGARLAARASEGDDRQRPGAAAARPPGAARRRRHVERACASR